MTTKSIEQANPGETLVRPNETVTIYATRSNPYSGEGEAMEVHPELAKKLIKAGKATDSAPAKAKKATDEK